MYQPQNRQGGLDAQRIAASARHVLEMIMWEDACDDTGFPEHSTLGVLCRAQQTCNGRHSCEMVSNTPASQYPIQVSINDFMKQDFPLSSVPASNILPFAI